PGGVEQLVQTVNGALQRRITHLDPQKLVEGGKQDRDIGNRSKQGAHGHLPFPDRECAEEKEQTKGKLLGNTWQNLPGKAVGTFDPPVDLLVLLQPLVKFLDFVVLGVEGLDGFQASQSMGQVIVT